MAIEDELYETVTRELEFNDLVKSLWVRAYAESDGDPERTRACYIRLRVEQLSDMATLKKQADDLAAQEMEKQIQR